MEGRTLAMRNLTASHGHPSEREQSGGTLLGATRAASSSGRPPAVVAHGLSKTYMPSPRWMKMMLKSAIDEPVVALDDVSFEVADGEIMVVIGPNGAGKSTLFRILTGLTTPTSGTARIVDRDITDGRHVRSLIGFMPAEEFADHVGLALLPAA